MKPHQQACVKYLTYSGTLPPIFCTFSQRIYEPFDARFVAACYGAVMISFLSGIHSATYLFFCEKCPRNLFITSDVTALIAWISLPTCPLRFVFLLQVFSFPYLLRLDLALERTGLLPQWPYNAKRNATIIAPLAVGTLMVSRW